MIQNFYFTDIPTWDNGTWTKTTFENKVDFIEICDSLFKEPGEYNFNETTARLFNEQGSFFEKNQFYTDAPYKSADYIKYWDFEKAKCRKGLIIKLGKDTWYLTRAYYMWLNFLPIFDKIDNKYAFPKIWDTQYHMRLYDFRAELKGLNSVCMKKRQIAYSYQMCAEMITEFWFEEGSILKIGASDKGYISDEGTWKYLNEYRDFLNQHTAWYRPTNPGGVLHWEQKEEETIGGKKQTFGNKSMILGRSFEKSPTKGVGGRCRKFWYEEGGIAPTADKTFKYLEPAQRQGQIKTGIFYLGGSVGELDKCEPLKKYLLRPIENKFLGVEHKLMDSKGTVAVTGLFIPEQWSMPPYIDAYGNSLVQEALEALDKDYEKLKENLDPAEYQLEISQRPRNIEEALASRKESKFPLHILQAQEMRIANKEYSVEYLDLDYNEKGELEAKRSMRYPIMDFPVKKEQKDKRACISVWERPCKDPSFGQYYASIDPVSEGATTTSDSLCSIIVYKAPTEVTVYEEDGTSRTEIEGDKIVATWCGRYDDINETHQQLLNIITWYNAWTIIENNVPIFITYMILKKKQHFLVPKDKMLFLKELTANSTVRSEYGWKNVGVIFKTHLLSHAIEYVKEVINEEHATTGKVVKRVYGVERIPDPMLIKEMKAYVDGLNVDRLVSFCALVAFIKVQTANKGFAKRVINKDLDKNKDLYKLTKSPFKHFGGMKQSIRKSPFKNIR